MIRSNSRHQRHADDVPLTPEALAAAYQAADAAGISLQDWLTRAIITGLHREPDHARAGLSPARSSAASPTVRRLAEHPIPDWSGAAKVRHALARLARREAERYGRANRPPE